MKTAADQIRELQAELAQAGARATAAEERATKAEAEQGRTSEDLRARETDLAAQRERVAALEAENTRLKAADQDLDRRASLKAAELVARLQGVPLDQSPDAAAAKPTDAPKPQGRALVAAAIGAALDSKGFKLPGQPARN